jgi:hypothetical protein
MLYLSFEPMTRKEKWNNQMGTLLRKRDEARVQREREKKRGKYNKQISKKEKINRIDKQPQQRVEEKEIGCL